jgi:hypothetical protein
MIENIFYVYVLMDTRRVGPFKYSDYEFSHEPYYIGKGSGNRRFDHLKYAKRHHKLPGLKDKRTRDIIRETLSDPIIRVFASDMVESAAFDAEINLISVIGRVDCGTGPLLNQTSGGDGGSGHIQSPALRLRRSQIAKIWWENASEEDKTIRSERQKITKALKREKQPPKKIQVQLQQERLDAASAAAGLKCLAPYQGAGKKLSHACLACSHVWDRLPGYTINGGHGCPECMKKAASSRRRSEPIACPHCGKSGHPAAMPRWHFDNCKHRGIS